MGFSPRPPGTDDGDQERKLEESSTADDGVKDSTVAVVAEQASDVADLQDHGNEDAAKVQKIEEVLVTSHTPQNISIPAYSSIMSDNVVNNRHELLPDAAASEVVEHAEGRNALPPGIDIPEELLDEASQEPTKEADQGLWEALPRDVTDGVLGDARLEILQVGNIPGILGEFGTAFCEASVSRMHI